MKTTTLLSDTPKKSKAVLLLSTMHHNDAIDIESSNARKPEILTFYNMTIGGVDTTDKLCATYNVGRRTRRWPFALFFHLINICALNAYVIYNHNTPVTTMERRTFLKLLGKELVKPYQMNCLECPQVPRKIRKLLGDSIQPQQQEEPEAATSSRNRCYLCIRAKNRYSKQICTQCKKNICSEHTIKLCK